MNSTRRGFLSAFTGWVVLPPWRNGSNENSPGSTHDKSASIATAAPQSNQAHPALLATSGPTQSCAATSLGELSSEDSPFNDPAWLTAWLRLPRLPVLRDQLPQIGADREIEWYLASLALSRIGSGKSIDFTYHGGFEPGTFREVVPMFLYAVPSNLADPDLAREPLYLLAHCLHRKAPRTFRLDRIAL